MKRVLISGGAGFIGSHTADGLLARGYEVAVLDNLSKPVHDGSGRWPDYLNKRIKKIKGDVTEKADWKKALKGVSHVVHLAAFQDLVPDFSRFFETNAVGTANLYQVIVEEKLPIKRVVVASSQFVYGEGKYKCKKHGLVYPSGRELKVTWEPICPMGGEKIERLDLTEDRADPRNQYSISKYTQELIGLRLGKLYNIPTNAMRYSIVQGSRQSFRNSYSGVLRLFITRAMKGVKPTIYEDGKQLRDYVSVHDVVSANLQALECDQIYEVFNVGGGKAYTVLEFYEQVEKILNSGIGYELPGAYRVGDTRHSVSDISKLKKMGWKPRGSIDKSIQEYYDWVKKMPITKEELLKKDAEFKKSGAVRYAKNLHKNRR